MDTMPRAHPIKLPAVGRERYLDITKTLAPSQTGEGHDAELLGAIHPAHPGIAAVAVNNPAEARPRHKLHRLSEQCLANVHGIPSLSGLPGIEQGVGMSFQIGTKSFRRKPS